MSDQPRLGLSLPQILAGALAAASAAVASSWLGVAGTVIGAAVMSVVASVASVLYARPIERSSHRIRAAIPAMPVLSGPVAAPVTEPPSATTPDRLDRDDRLDHADTSPGPSDGPSGPLGRPVRGIAWRTVAASAAAMLIAGLGMLTGFELLTGQSASVTGAGRDRAPTIVRIIQGDEGPGDSSSGGTTVTDDPETTDGGGLDEPDTTGSTDAPNAPSETGTTTGPDSSDPTDSAPTDSAPTDSAPTDSAPTDSAPTDSAPTEPQPTDFAPTESEPIESTASEDTTGVADESTPTN